MQSSPLSALAAEPLGFELLDNERSPLLFLEVNLGKSRQEKLIIYEGDEPEQIVQIFAGTFGLSKEKEGKLMSVVRDQLAVLLPRIIEEAADHQA